jgi:hypothetical protein
MYYYWNQQRQTPYYNKISGISTQKYKNPSTKSSGFSRNELFAVRNSTWYDRKDTTIPKILSNSGNTSSRSDQSKNLKGPNKVITGLEQDSSLTILDPKDAPRIREAHPLEHPKWKAITEERGPWPKCLEQVFPTLLPIPTLLAPEILQ